MAFNLMKLMGMAVNPRFGTRIVTPKIAANGTGGVVTTEFPIYVDERASLEEGLATVVKVTLTYDASLATNANNPTFKVGKRTAGGAFTAIATVNCTTTALTAWVPVAVSNLTTTLAPGDILTLQVSQPATTGIAVDATLIEVEIDRG